MFLCFLAFQAAVNATGVAGGSWLVFLCVGGGGERVVLGGTAGLPLPPPVGGACWSWGLRGRAARPPLTCASLAPRCCTCIVTRALCPSAASAPWAGMAATVSSTSRRRCRTHGPSPSSCWPTPSKAARPSRSVPHPPSSVSPVLAGTRNLARPPVGCVQAFGCAMGHWPRCAHAAGSGSHMRAEGQGMETTPSREDDSDVT